jgi:hypothetical protein
VANAMPSAMQSAKRNKSKLFPVADDQRAIV